MKRQSIARKDESSWGEAFKTIAHTIFWGGLWILVMAGVYQGWRALNNPALLPIKQVEVAAGDVHVSPAELEHQLSPYVQGVTLLNLNETALKQALMQFPWIDNVSIRRVWPAKLVITITEQVPVARWGHNQLLNKELEVFSPPLETFPTSLPSFFGPSGSEPQLWHEYKELNHRLAPLKLKIISLQLSPRNSWSFLLSNDVEVILGRDDLEARLTRLVKLYPRLVADRDQAIAMIDLRYPNGMAVKWKSEKTSLTD